MLEEWRESTSLTKNKSSEPNLFLEVVVMRGDQVLGQRNPKIRRDGGNKEERGIQTSIKV